MLFNSIDFAVFLPIVFILYWFIANKNLKIQNLLIVISSYIFYGWWDSRFLVLILFSSIVDFYIGKNLQLTTLKSKRFILLWISITINLGFLGFFKYYNFFLENFTTAFTLFGYNIPANTLNIILPVGISFYTFQTLSYTIDIYRGKLTPTRDFIVFSAFVSFFPQLVAGPIERSTHLLPQFYHSRSFDYKKAADGMRQILWGLFKKVVIADNCAKYANLIFNNSSDFSGSTLLLGAIFFTFQIYGDFSGYSDIAIGTSRLFGFDLRQNFNFPYFSRDIAEFWRRWHISLSSWFRDYLYIPLGGSRGGIWNKVRNTFIIFLVSGFWHGANWTFIFWGGLNAIYFLPLLLSNRNRNHVEIIAKGKLFPSFKEFFYVLKTFMLTVIAWIVFRAENLNHAFSYISTIFTESLFSIPNFTQSGRIQIESLLCIFMMVIFIFIEWLGREEKFAFAISTNIQPDLLRWSAYLLLIVLTVVFSGGSQDFIYFQF